MSATTASLGHVLEEQQFVKRPEREKRLILEGPLQDDEGRWAGLAGGEVHAAWVGG